MVGGVLSRVRGVPRSHCGPLRSIRGRFSTPLERPRWRRGPLRSVRGPFSTSHKRPRRRRGPLRTRRGGLRTVRGPFCAPGGGSPASGGRTCPALLRSVTHVFGCANWRRPSSGEIAAGTRRLADVISSRHHSVTPLLRYSPSVPPCPRAFVPSSECSHSVRTHPRRKFFFILSCLWPDRLSGTREGVTLISLAAVPVECSFTQGSTFSDHPIHPCSATARFSCRLTEVN